MRIRTSFAPVILLLCFFAVGALAQGGGRTHHPERQFNASCRLPNGIRVAFANETEPPGAIQFALSMVETEAAGGIHRVFIDEAAGVFFGYDVKVEPVPNTKQIRVFILPMSEEYEQRLRKRATFQTRSVNQDFKSPSLFQTQTSHVVNDGDMLSIDALVNQSTGVKIVEIIKTSLEEIQLGGNPAKTDEVRDFSIDDVELTVMNYRLRVDGEVIAGDRPTGGCSGAVIWFYLPERGRFILSIRPHQGYDFQKIGVIGNNRISFTAGGEHYEWISTTPVVNMSGRFNLWVLHDSAYRPELDELVARLQKDSDRVRQSGSKLKDVWKSGLLIGAADRIEFLLRREK